MGDSARWQRPAGWMARWGAGRTTRGTRSQGLERGTGYLAAPRWLYLRPQHSSPSPCFRSVGAPAGANGQERAAGGGKARGRGCSTGRGVRRGDSAPCTAQVACTTGNGEMGDVRLVPRTCSTKVGLAPGQPARLFSAHGRCSLLLALGRKVPPPSWYLPKLPCQMRC